MKLLAALAQAFLVAATAAAPPTDLRALPATAVRVTDAFWGPRLETNRRVTMEHVLRQCEATGRIRNFEAAARALAGDREQRFAGLCFNDSDVYKALEGVALLLAARRDEEIERRCDAIIAKIAAAQHPDGYLYTAKTINDPKNQPPGGAERWADIAWGHELYCVGHLYEAAVAYHAATGKRALLDVAIRNADLLCHTFGPGKDPRPCGHPEIELALGRLYEATKNPKYLDLMRFFIEARGRGERPRYGEYAQDHAPVTEQAEAVGHAVRLGYLYAGVMDFARISGERAAADAAARVWDNIVAEKLYVTGGIGSQGNNEGFGAPFDLPNSTAYNETCSSIAFVMWSHRMSLADGDSRHADVMERTLYNALLAGWSLSGDRFFYPNPLESARGRERSPWFECACCPPNVLRLIADLPGYVYASGARDLVVNMYAGSEADVDIAGATVHVTQATNYPWSGDIALALTPNAPAAFALRLRIPGWSRGEPVPGTLYRSASVTREAPTLAVNGSPVAMNMEKGYAVIDRTWRRGDTVALSLPMPVERIVSDSRVLAGVGRAALQRGPIVYCFEGWEQADDANVLSYVAPLDGAWTARTEPSLLGGVVTLRGSVGIAERGPDGAALIAGRADATAIPYFAWANRGASPMNVWVATEPSGAKPRPVPTLASRAKASSSFGGDLGAIADQMEPRNSGDHDNAFLHWWPRKGTEEWIQYDLAAPTLVSAVEVYWFDDTGRGECRLPESWTLHAKVGTNWIPVNNPSGFGVSGDRVNRCDFEPIQASALRITVKSRRDWAGGIHEWRVIAASEQPATPAAATGNALPNGSFETLVDGAPQGWARSRWAGDGRHEIAAAGRTGQHSALISSEQGADIAWSSTVPVELMSRYRLSGWIRTENVVPIHGGAGALFNIHGLNARTTAVTGTTDWTRVQVEFDTDFNDSVMVNCLFGGWGQATGRAWFDDVSLELLHKGDVPAPRISIDAAAVGQPISPYIYGQFIEHLGRCIYGGIWAEMLEDRKFFHPVNAPESPWKSIGDAANVTMSVKEPFVGSHTPVITVADSVGGIKQDGLTLQPGKAYKVRLWIAGDVPRVDAILKWGDSRPSIRAVTIDNLTPDFTLREFIIGTSDHEGGARTVSASFELKTASKGSFRVGACSLMPADNIDGFRADTLALLKRLDSPVYRWPGGNFVSGYDWRDGIGDRDRRPPRKNPAWLGVEHNDVGIHEFMRLCELLKTDAYVAVNTGLGSVDNAVAELEYVNGAPDTPMGRLRAANGRAAPWNVKFWGIGNEMYGDWQLGNVPLAEYTMRHNAFVDAMRKVDPSITVIGVGAVGEWSRTMLRDCADHLTHLSEHVYWQDRAGLLAHVMQAPRSLKATADAHRAYRRQLDSLKGRDIRIVQDEWNYWYGPHVFGELGTRYFMKDALGCAAALNEFGRNSDLFFMANYAQTVNVIGAIKASPTNAAMETTGLVLELYRHHLGPLPCRTTTTPTIDALAAWSPDRRTLTIAVVNASTRPADIALDLTGATLTGTGIRREIAADDPMAFNDPDGPRPVQTRLSEVSGIGRTLSVAPCSVTVFSLGAR